MRDDIEAGRGFLHRVVYKAGRGDTLHIYIDGDGEIWRDKNRLLMRPQTGRSLALTLLRADPAPAILIGRPCYMQVDDARCAPQWWTAARYSAPVVASLAAVANRRARGYKRVYLIGYSGGGALAVLMAPAVPKTAAVVTLAGNLDTAAWAVAHHYSTAVVGRSLNPARRPPLAARIVQWHFVGDRDSDVDWHFVKRYADRQHYADGQRHADGQNRVHFELLRGVDHRCCWAALWPRLLAEVAMPAPR